MKLEIEHLAAYLPFRLKLSVFGICNGFVCYLVANNRITSFKDGMNINIAIEYKAKPILRPLSDINLEIIRELFGVEIHKFRFDPELDQDFALEVYTDIGWTSLTFEEYQTLLAHHFDLFKLIPRGLAIDINTIEK